MTNQLKVTMNNIHDIERKTIIEKITRFDLIIHNGVIIDFPM
jgi:hypothetical protein